MTITEMIVHMDCTGCETKIRKALQKLDGVDDIDIDMGMQKVTVMGWADQKKVLKAVRKTGRRAEFWPYPYNPDYYNFTQQYNHQINQQQQPQYYYNQNQYLPAVTYYNDADHDEKPVASSYNYYKYGYSDIDGYGYYQRPPFSTLDEKTSAMFSDDNPHACSIM